MSFLSPNDLIPGPQMMSVGFSLAGIAVADTRRSLSEALRKFEAAAAGVRILFSHSKAESDNLDHVLAIATTSELRAWLDCALQLETELSEASGLLTALLESGRFRASLNKFGLTGYAKVARFSKELGNEFAPFVRDLRLRAIRAVAKNAASAGIDVLDVTGDFDDMFRSASLEETRAWQETAYILANVESARKLTESMRATATDRSDEVSNRFADQSVSH